MFQYRTEIDGLRALAVLPVVFFHAGLSGFSGGYIGVDIFFVISGYLITSIILQERSAAKFSIIRFYERRARRILPALSLVLLVTTIFSYLLMPADLLKSYSQSLVSVVTFSSNVFFFLTNGYFSTVADEKPLLHTWSLAVEEQYYVFFPILISSLWFMGKKSLGWIIFGLACLSLGWAQYLASSEQTDANFYLIFSRAWELFAGSLIAFIFVHLASVKHWQRELAGVIGVSMIIYSICYFDKYTPFPSVYTLLPVLGTCLIIMLVNAQTMVGKLLSNKILVWIGLLSYSLYLWHQPIFAFLRIKTIGHPTQILFLGAIVMAAVLAYLTYKYVETPFRNKERFSQKRIFTYSSIIVAAFLCIGLSGHYSNGLPQRFDTSPYLSSIEPSPKRASCHTSGEDYLSPEDACRYFGSKITWASFGDSHTIEPAYVLAQQLQKSDVGLLHLSFSNCPPALLFEVKLAGCTKWLREAFTYLESQNNIKNVLLGFRYSTFLYGDQLYPYPNIPNESPKNKLSKKFREKNKEQNIRELYWQSLRIIIDRLIKSGKTIYLLYPIPELPIHISKAVIPFSVFSHSTLLDLEQSTTVQYYNARNAFILDKLNSLEYGQNLHAIKSFDTFCTNKYCPAVINDGALYFDDDHLSLYGSKFVLEKGPLKHKFTDVSGD